MSLLEQLMHTVQQMENNPKMEIMELEHEIFIPEIRIKEDEETTMNFLKTVKELRDGDNFNIDIYVEEAKVMKIRGLRVIFKFTKDVNYPSVIDYIKKSLRESK